MVQLPGAEGGRRGLPASWPGRINLGVRSKLRETRHCLPATPRKEKINNNKKKRNTRAHTKSPRRPHLLCPHGPPQPSPPPAPGRALGASRQGAERPRDGGGRGDGGSQQGFVALGRQGTGALLLPSGERSRFAPTCRPAAPQHVRPRAPRRQMARGAAGRGAAEGQVQGKLLIRYGTLSSLIPERGNSAPSKRRTKPGVGRRACPLPILKSFVWGDGGGQAAGEAPLGQSPAASQQHPPARHAGE